MKELANSFISTCPFPAVTDVAGVVVDVGPGVKDLAPGDEVVAMLNSLVSERGFWQHLSIYVCQPHIILAVAEWRRTG
jgi:NADPH:quinone reductase-like Zn-dependent oxidoreductase